MVKELDVKISYQCNNACVFCLNKDKRKIKDDFKAIKKNIEEFTKNGGERLIISGGEPLISNNFFNLIFFSKKKGIKFFNIQTNARMLYYENTVKKLKNFEPINFLVSFHFPNKKLYKKYCQSDGFDQTIKGLKNLIQYNCNFLINTVVMKKNLYYLEDVIKILRSIGISQGIQYRFIDGKNVISDYKKFVPQYSECSSIIEKIIKKNKDIKIYLSEFPFCVLKKESRKNAGIFIDPKRFNLSNKDGEIFFTKEITDKQFIFPKCKNCLHKKKCLGVRKEYVDVYGPKEFNPIINYNL